MTDVHLYASQVLERQAGVGVLRQQEGHGDARGLAGSEHRLREEDRLPGERESSPEGVNRPDIKQNAGLLSSTR